MTTTVVLGFAANHIWWAAPDVSSFLFATGDLDVLELNQVYNGEDHSVGFVHDKNLNTITYESKWESINKLVFTEITTEYVKGKFSGKLYANYFNHVGFIVLITQPFSVQPCLLLFQSL